MAPLDTRQEIGKELRRLLNLNPMEKDREAALHALAETLAPTSPVTITIAQVDAELYGRVGFSEDTPAGRIAASCREALAQSRQLVLT